MKRSMTTAVAAAAAVVALSGLPFGGAAEASETASALAGPAGNGESWSIERGVPPASPQRPIAAQTPTATSAPTLLSTAAPVPAPSPLPAVPSAAAATAAAAATKAATATASSAHPETSLRGSAQATSSLHAAGGSLGSSKGLLLSSLDNSSSHSGGDLGGAEGLLLGSPDMLALPCSELQNLTSSVNNPRVTYLEGLNKWLHEERYQTALALLMAIAGAVCAWDGPRVWQALFTGAIAVVAALVASLEADARELTHAAHALVVLQVSAVVWLATWSGFEGTQVMLGSIVGAVGAYGIGGWARWVDTKMPSVAVMDVLWCAAGAVAGFAMVTYYRKPLLASLAPLLGGFLISASFGVLASRSLGVLTDQDRVSPLPPPDLPWTEVAGALLGTCSSGVLAAHVGCALGTVFVMNSKHTSRPLAVLCLVIFALTTMLSAALSKECGHLKGAVRCPPWLQPAKHGAWEWSVAGCALWVLLTAIAAWRQLGMLEDWESNNFWRNNMFGEGRARLAGGFRNVPFGVLPPGHGRYSGVPTQGELDFGNNMNGAVAPVQRSTSCSVIGGRVPLQINQRSQSFAVGTAIAEPAEDTDTRRPLVGGGGWRSLTFGGS